MSTMVSLRGFGRNKSIDVDGKPVRGDKTTFVNLDNARVRRDIARHSAVGGALFPYGDTFFQNDDGTVTGTGGQVKVRTTTLVTDVTATQVLRAAGAKLSVAAGTATVGAADVTNPRIDIVAVDTSAAGAYVVIAGTATAGANLTNRLGMAALPANRVALAAILVPNGATTLNQNNVLDIRP